jgi:hypothetical protein
MEAKFYESLLHSENLYGSHFNGFIKIKYVNGQTKQKSSEQILEKASEG